MTAIERKETLQERYDKAHTTFVGLKLNNNTDADILAALEGKAKQTELKRLVRVGLQHEDK